jgi:hypothetical protein
VDRRRLTSVKRRGHQLGVYRAQLRRFHYKEILRICGRRSSKNRPLPVIFPDHLPPTAFRQHRVKQLQCGNLMRLHRAASMMRHGEPSGMWPLGRWTLGTA